MSRQQFISTSIRKKTGVALALTLALGWTAFSAGSASANPMRTRDGSSPDGKSVFGFTYSPASRDTGSCEGRQGAAILGGFTDESPSAYQGAACRY